MTADIAIDNSIAEYSICPLTIERKNKMAFGSHKVAKTSTVYHTFVSIYKMGALSFRQFLKNYLTAFVGGRTDFENLPQPYWEKSIKEILNLIVSICLIRVNIWTIKGFQIANVLIGHVHTIVVFK